MSAKAVPKSGSGTGRTSLQDSHKIGRDSTTGQFMPVKDAQKDPKHTTVETIKNPKKGK